MQSYMTEYLVCYLCDCDALHYFYVIYVVYVPEFTELEPEGSQS